MAYRMAYGMAYGMAGMAVGMEKWQNKGEWHMKQYYVFEEWCERESYK